MSDCHICGRMVQTVRFPSCKCRIEMVRLQAERDAALAENRKLEAAFRVLQDKSAAALVEVAGELPIASTSTQTTADFLHYGIGKGGYGEWVCQYCQKPRIVSTSTTTGCCDGERQRAGYMVSDAVTRFEKIRNLRMRWREGCPSCGNQLFRSDTFRTADIAGTGEAVTYTCPKCNAKESAGNL